MQESQNYRLNGYLILIALAVPFAIAIYNFANGNAMNAALFIYIQLIGIIFLFAYFFEKNNFVFKYAIKVCMKSTPKSRYMAFFYFGIATLFSLLYVLK